MTVTVAVVVKNSFCVMVSFCVTVTVSFCVTVVVTVGLASPLSAGAEATAATCAGAVGEGSPGIRSTREAVLILGGPLAGSKMLTPALRLCWAGGDWTAGGGVFAGEEGGVTTMTV